ncbi:PBECR2 nuclease fold domain-containing protein [Vibrio parahaemolyticus]
MTSEVKGQHSWQDYDLMDLRKIDLESHTASPDELKRADSIEGAVSLVADTFGLGDGEDATKIKTVIGDVLVQRSNIEHIVEKRNDARERYAPHALATITNPFEVWEVLYDNGDKRYAFISLFSSKRQVLVVVSIWENNVLWNFMNTDKKGLNKHRHGNLIFSAMNAEKQKAANE